MDDTKQRTKAARELKWADSLQSLGALNQVTEISGVA